MHTLLYIYMPAGDEAGLAGADAGDHLRQEQAVDLSQRANLCPLPWLERAGVGWGSRVTGRGRAAR